MSSNSTSSASSDADTEDRLVSTAIIAIFVWLVPHLSLEIAEYRLSLLKSSAWNKSSGKLDEGLRTILKNAVIAITVGVLTIAITATLIGLSTRNLDTRMVSVVSGLSRFMASTVCFFISFKIPKWLGVYHSERIEYGEPVGKTTTVLGFNVRWSLFSHFFQVYFYLLPFYCGVHPATIPISAVVGCIVGIVLGKITYWGRTRFKKKKLLIAIAFAAGLSILSAAAMAQGVYFVQTVWKRTDPTMSYMALFWTVFVSWLAIEAIVHVALWRISKREFKRMEIRMSVREQARLKYRTVLFDPDLAMKIRREATAYADDDDGEQSPSEPVPADIEDLASGSSSPRPDSEAENPTANGHAKEETPEGAQPDPNTTTSSNGHDDPEDSVVGQAEGVLAKHRVSLESARHVDFEYEDRNPDSSNDEENPTYRELLRAKLCGWCCGGRWSRNDYPVAPERGCMSRTFRVIQWIFNAVVYLGFLYLTIVNIGASFQVDTVMKQLPSTYALLYPPSYNDGPVCAFDNQGPKSNITTFATPEAAHDAGFLVLHCGECGACSTWQNLKANWVTRKDLASLSQACAKKLLFGGFEAAVQCHLDTIGFDYNCTGCWITDEMCARDNCVFIFLQASLVNSVGNFAVGPGTITSATCDEAMCGPTFVPCSGATRRRMDIKSDIARPAYQQCRQVQVNWTDLFGP
jgi:hypothetical protein